MVDKSYMHWSNWCEARAALKAGRENAHHAYPGKKEPAVHVVVVLCSYYAIRHLHRFRRQA